MSSLPKSWIPSGQGQSEQGISQEGNFLRKVMKNGTILNNQLKCSFFTWQKPCYKFVFFFFFKGSDFISTCGFKMLVSVGEVLVHLAFGCCVTQFVFSISSENSTWEREDLTIERLCITFVRESWHVLWTCFIHPHSCLHSEREGIHILHH